MVDHHAELAKRYTVAGIIGRGQFETVYSCTKKEEGGHMYAMKIVKVSHFKDSPAEVKVAALSPSLQEPVA